MDEHEKALREVSDLFLGRSRRPRAKPNRCRLCQRVTRYIYCPECSKRRARERAIFPAGGSAVGEKNLSLGQPGKSKIVDAALASRCPKCGGSDVRKATLFWQCLTCSNEWTP